MSIATAVRERPILMSAPMVRAILDGRKTQTRRDAGLRIVNANPKTWTLDILARASALFRSKREGELGKAVTARCPYGAIGDRLWVRETWAAFDPIADAFPGGIGYRADIDDCGQVLVGGVHRSTHNTTWRPSIFMPRTACRIELELVDVRVERLHAIKADDALAEGVPVADLSDVVPPARPGIRAVRALSDFRKLWNEVNGPAAWDRNPWVWALSFRRVTP